MTTGNDPYEQAKGSLRRTRFIALLLLVLVVLLQVTHQRKLDQLRRLTDRARWLYPYVPKLDRHFDFTIDFYGMKYTGNTYADYDILFAGAAEKPDIYFMRDAMKALQPDGGGVFVDVGAAKGHHSLFMSKHADRVVAVEPYPPAVERIRKLIALNDSKNIEVLPVGFGDTSAKIPFYAQSSGQLNTGSFAQEFSKDNEPYGTLDIRIGDRELAKLDLRSVDIVKIDVEGFEKNVLIGLRNTLAKHRAVVVMELLPESVNPATPFGSRADLESVFPRDYEFLQFVEYEIYSGHYRLAILDFDAHMNRKRYPLEATSRNIVACPRERMKDLALAN